MHMSKAQLDHKAFQELSSKLVAGLNSVSRSTSYLEAAAASSLDFVGVHLDPSGTGVQAGAWWVQLGDFDTNVDHSTEAVSRLASGVLEDSITGWVWLIVPLIRDKLHLVLPPLIPPQVWEKENKQLRKSKQIANKGKQTAEK